jgi:hypothetical protein
MTKPQNLLKFEIFEICEERETLQEGSLRERSCTYFERNNLQNSTDRVERVSEVDSNDLKEEPQPKKRIYSPISKT